MILKEKKIISHSILEVFLYLGYFPKILSGPIQNSKDFFEQINKKRQINFQSLSEGIQIFMFGLFKKIVLADRLSVFVDQVYNHTMSFSSITVFLATIAYSLLIYFDFSGYSDMAIGISKIFNINLPRNFNMPYISHNVTEFWKRWHITLSSWLQEYVYISMGGNRKGTFRTYLNLILTMVIGGIWHGANIAYIIWGLLHGIALAIHKVWMKLTNSQKKQHSLFSNIISIIITFLFTNFCWIFFKTENISKSLKIIKKIFSFEQGINQPYLYLFTSLILLIIITIIVYKKSIKQNNTLKKQNTSLINGYYPILNLNKFWNLVIFFVFCGIVFALAYTGGSPFIYGNY